jgi:hypothetical protein
MTGKLIWKSEQEQVKEFEYIKKTRAERFGRDGYVVSAEGIFQYWGIKYLIRVLRYFTYSDGFKPMGTRKSSFHTVVEYPEESKGYVNMALTRDKYSEFLYHDTLHMWNDLQSVDEQIAECHILAKRDINSIFWLRLLYFIRVKK